MNSVIGFREEVVNLVAEQVNRSAAGLVNPDPPSLLNLARSSHPTVQKVGKILDHFGEIGQKKGR